MLDVLILGLQCYRATEPMDDYIDLKERKRGGGGRNHYHPSTHSSLCVSRLSLYIYIIIIIIKKRFTSANCEGPIRTRVMRIWTQKGSLLNEGDYVACKTSLILFCIKWNLLVTRRIIMRRTCRKTFFSCVYKNPVCFVVSFRFFAHKPTITSLSRSNTQIAAPACYHQKHLSNHTISPSLIVLTQ
jgi:hypothetical protein